MYFESEEVKACIVTCGGLCPGLNTVIRELVCGLSHMYNVNDVFGIQVRIILDYLYRLWMIQHVTIPSAQFSFFQLVVSFSLCGKS